MKNFIRRVKDKLAESSVTISVTQELLQKVLEGALKSDENIKNLTVCIKEDHISIIGTAKKLLISIKFIIILEPQHSEKRMLFLKVKDMKPINHNWIKDKVLNRYPILIYKDDKIIFDLNQIDKIRAIPMGNIRRIEINNGKLKVTIGL